jgi:polyisoprenoid-binding protein YceI
MTYIGEHPLAQAVPSFAGRQYVAFTGHARVLRSDFGMAQSQPWVSDAINIDITIEATYRPPA